MILKDPSAVGRQSPPSGRSADWPFPPGWLDVLTWQVGFPPPIKREMPQREVAPESPWGVGLARPMLAREARTAMATA